MRFHMTLRFGYGAYAPWVVRLGEHGINATAGPIASRSAPMFRCAVRLKPMLPNSICMQANR